MDERLMKALVAAGAVAVTDNHNVGRGFDVSG